MAQEDTALTPTETKIREAFKDHPQMPYLGKMADNFKIAVDDLHSRGARQDIIALAAVTHLAGMLAAQKIASIVPNTLIDLLLDDLVDTVRNRAIVGVVDLHTKQ